MKRPATALTLLLLFFSTAPFAQTSEDEESNLERIVSGYLSVSAGDDEPYRIRFIDTSGLAAFLNKRGFRSEVEIRPKTNVRFMPRLVFSGTIADPQLLSPAYSNVGIGPRTSLNIDIVTGKYYWEW